MKIRDVPLVLGGVECLLRVGSSPSDVGLVAYLRVSVPELVETGLTIEGMSRIDDNSQVFEVDGDQFKLFRFAEQGADTLHAKVTVNGLQASLLIPYPSDGEGEVATVDQPRVGSRHISFSENPMRTKTSIFFPSQARASQEVRILSVTGRLVKILASHGQVGQERVVTWDGFDEAGKRVPSGLYLVAIADDHSITSGRLVVVN